jgi:ribosylpyrimidine nucleosidase
MPQKVILDVDTGGDDAVAILLAGHHPMLELVAVTVTHGNAPLEVTLDNTLRVMQAGGLTSVPVYSGAHSQLIGPPIPTHRYQSETLPLPPAALIAQPKHAVQFLIEYYLGPHGAETVYMPVGPQTNLALALRLEPRLAQRIPRIIMMAGALYEGNVTPSAEFNVLADPEAAHIVFSSGIPMTMIGLEVTSQAPVNEEVVKKTLALGTPQAQIAARLMQREIDWFREHLGTDGQIFDACAVAAAIDPTLVKTRPMHVWIELYGQWTRGRTVADVSGYQRKPANVDVGVSIDRERFYQVLYDGLA